MMHLAFSLQINDLLALASTLNGLLGGIVPNGLVSLPGITIPGLDSSLGSPLNALGTGLGLPGVASAINGL